MKTSLFLCFWGLVFTLLCLPDIAFAAPPSITDQPTNQTVAVGGTAVFSVTARGRAPMYYQWNLNETNPLVGATNTTLTLTNVQSANAGAYSVTVTNLSGSVTSSNAVLTVLMPPSITLQPAGCTNVAGATASFTVAADGATPLSYQWQKNGSGLTDGGNVSGATTTNLTLSNMQDADAASYTVVVTNIAGSITSAPAILAVVDPPTITTQPANQTGWAGSNVTFSITADGTPPLNYQWQFNGTNINGSTNTSLTLTNVQVAQAGNYAVLVTNAAGFILSSNAVLTVAKSGPVLVCDEVDLQAAMVAGGNITFGCDGVITLTKTLAINTDTTLDGTGHTATISGGNAVQLFSVSSNVTVSFINLTLANGCSAGPNGMANPPVTDGQPGMGGAILNNGGTVALTGCTVVSNTAVGGTGLTGAISAGGPGFGGAIYNSAGAVFVTNCDFVANGAAGGGGGSGNMYGGGNGGTACGGAIYSLGGNVVVQNSAFVLHVTKGGNAGYDGAAISASAGSAFGGVIYSTNATVNFYNSTFTSNSVTGTDTSGSYGTAGWGAGGAIFAQSGVVNCIGCIFATNTAAGGYAFKSYAPGSASGGAICSYASMSVSQSSFWGNRASGNSGGWAVGAGNGGAIFNGNSLSLSGNTFVQNAVVGGNGMSLLAMGNTPGGMGRGGSVYSQGTLTATNCTFAANSAQGGAAGTSWMYGLGAGGDGAGGGLFNNGTATLANLTFATNSAIGGAGSPGIGDAPPPGPTGLTLGGAICNSSGTVNLYNTIVANSPSGSNCWGTVSDLGYNLSSDASAGFSAPGSLNNTDPVLGPLGDYGGPTLTVPLLAGSPAIDGGNTATAPPTDQRGHARPYGVAADIGAFESSPPFFIGGQIIGLMGSQAVVAIGSSNTVTTGSGTYGLAGFAAGSYTVIPSCSNFLFAPVSSLVTVGPDQVNINFIAYLGAGDPPTITAQPVSRTNVVGTMATFTVTADGTAPLNYQWTFNGTNINGATNATLLFTNVQITQTGNYAVWITNYYGSVLSSNATLTVNLPVSCVPPPVGLMGWWRGEGSALDFVGGNNGSITGGVTYATGEVGEAFAFNGIDGYITAPVPVGLQNGTASGITIECWIEPAAATTEGPIVVWSHGLQFCVQPGLQLLADFSPYDYKVFSPAGLLSTNSFQHVALTYDNSSGWAVIYLNGIPVVSTNIGSFTPMTSGTYGPMYFGMSNQYFSGLVDELCLYNRALSQNEIQSIYNAGGDGKCPLPVITVQPAGQLVTVRSTVTFSVTAGSATPLSYQWTFGGTNLVGATDASLTLTNIQLSQGGNYAVWVANDYGSVLSSNAVVTVGIPPSIITQPTNQTVPVGGTANVSVTADGTPPLSYQWYLWHVGGAQGGTTNSSLTLTNVQFDPNGIGVEVEVRNAFGYVDSVEATVTVLAVPSIIMQPTNQVAAVGSTVSFAVAAGGLTPFSYQWSFNGTNILRGTNATLTLSNVQFTNAGNYAVLVTNIAGSALSSNALLTVGLPPSITTQPSSRTNVAGTTATFTVTASGLLPLNYQWSLNGANLINATNTTLTLTNVQWWQAGSYAVQVTNVLGSALSSNAVLTVQSPPYITIQPANQVAAVGGTTSFSVTAGGLAPLHYQWNFNGTNLAKATNTTLTLTNVQLNQAGNYAVRVTNTLGSILSSNAVLTVNNTGTVPVCDEADLQAAVAAGGTITFGCDGVITLTKTLAVTRPTTLDGTGHTVTISGGNAVQLFSVNAGVSASFLNLTLANGYAVGSNGTASTDGQPGMGGAILNNGGVVALTGCTVVSNVAVGGAGYPNCIYPTNSTGGVALGGAVYNLAGNVSVTNCNFSANGVTGGTGGHNLGYGGAGGDACGGAIYSSGGSVTVQNSTFLSHTAQGGTPGQGPAVFYGPGGSAFGGGIYSSSATLNFNNSTFTGNSATGAGTGGDWFGSDGWGYGGAVFAQGGVVNCIGCTFTTNTAVGGGAIKTYAGSAWGGAICSYASMSVSQSSFWGNRATGSMGGESVGEGSGGAIFNGNSLFLSDNTFVQNAVVGGNGMSLLAMGNTPGGMGRGGAVCSQGTLTVTNCTFAANSAQGGAAGTSQLYGLGAGGDGAGGGLFNNGTVTLVNLTFATNSAIGGAGSPGIGDAPPPGPTGLALGGAICNSNGTVNLYNTILAGSTSGTNCFGALTDLGYNLSSDASAGFAAPGSLNNTDPVLGPLGDYGGPTLTVPLLAGSPAIDGGNTATAPSTDQRGHARPYGAAADIGAFESSPPFFIGGQVSGQTLRDEVTIIIGSSNLVTINLGSYGAVAFAAGSYTITPASPNYLFIPASQPLTVGPDQFGINFKAYHWNALSLEAVTNGVMHCVIADTNGLTCRMLISSNLFDWLPVSTNVVGPGNYFDVFLPITNEPMRYYRTAIP